MPWILPSCCNSGVHASPLCHSQAYPPFLNGHFQPAHWIPILDGKLLQVCSSILSFMIKDWFRCALGLSPT